MLDDTKLMGHIHKVESNGRPVISNGSYNFIASCRQTTGITIADENIQPSLNAPVVPGNNLLNAITNVVKFENVYALVWSSVTSSMFSVPREFPLLL